MSAFSGWIKVMSDQMLGCSRRASASRFPARGRATSIGHRNENQVSLMRCPCELLDNLEAATRSPIG